MSFPRYPEYKDSGVPWLGEVPAHWQVIPLIRTASGSNELFIDGDWIESSDLADEGIRYITTGNVGEGKYKEQGMGYISEATFQKLRCTEVLPGDVLVSRLNMPIGRACIVPDLGGKVVTSVDNVIVRTSDHFDRRFLIFLLSCKSHFANMENLARGTTMQRISRSALGRVRFAFPPVVEQMQIAALVDSETSKIDALVAEQEKLMGLLKEKRQAVISHAVTKGLDPAVPMKDSGVEWLGEVPAHWTVTPLGILASAIQTGPFGSQLHSDEYVEGGTPVINPSNIQAGELVPISSCTVNEEVVERLAHHKLRVGDIVFARRGEMGRCALVQRGSAGWLCGTGSLNVRLLPNALPEFVTAYLGSPYVRQLLELESVGSTMDNLNTQILSNVSVPTPPVSEQRMIVERASLLTTEIDGLIDQASRVSELLSERRAALISAAVTGKIDVRDTKKALAA